jgi:hypothetical protein
LIDVYLNGEPVAKLTCFQKKAGSKVAVDTAGVNNHAVINRSKVNKTVVLSTAILQGNRTQTVKGDSSFTKNAVILICYKGQYPCFLFSIIFAE